MVGGIRRPPSGVAPSPAPAGLGSTRNPNLCPGVVTSPTFMAQACYSPDVRHASKGTTVMVIDDADGNTWIMKGFELGMHPQRTYVEFMAAGPAIFKQLPEGWKARIVTLEQDNHEVPENGVATIMADEFFNVYDKTGPGMSNYKP